MRERMRIPACPSCGVHCSVCSGYKTNPPHDFCCLSSQLAREGQIQDSTPPEHPYDGESGDAFNAQIFAGKPE